MIVLGLETSCDETGLALYDSELGLRGQVLYSQIKLHAEYGGVVPELASRDHVRKMIPLINQLLEQSGVQKNQIDAVAYTRGPGLMGALMTGALFGRTLAFALNKPAIGVHHMEGHMLAPLLSETPPEFPFVAYWFRVDTLNSWQPMASVNTNCSVSQLMMQPVKPLIKSQK